MARTLGNKFIQVIPALLLVTFGAMALMQLIPGSASELVLGPDATAKGIAEFNHRYGFDRGLFDQYWHWLTSALHGNFGLSTQTGEPVATAIHQALPTTLEIALLAMALSLLIAVPLAIFAAYRADGRLDRFITGGSSLMLAAPTFVTGVVVVYLFAVKFQIFPSSGWVPISQDLGENLRHAALPVLVLVAAVTPLMLRVLRSDIVSILREDFVLTARARGLPTWYILTRHVLRPASLSLLTVSGLVFGFLFGGSVIVETYFVLPGLGHLVSNAVTAKDSPLILGVVVIVATTYLLLNIAIDLCGALIDPRIRSGVKS